MRFVALLLVLDAALALAAGFPGANAASTYYHTALRALHDQEQALAATIAASDPAAPRDRERILTQLRLARTRLKAVDFWIRYFEPIAYLKLNGPIPVEWENEVFEKYERPYRRDGAGLSLVEQALRDGSASRDSLVALLDASAPAYRVFEADSITAQLDRPQALYLANRLYLLNLAAIYTTGFECPDTANLVPELRSLLASVAEIYAAHAASFPGQSLPPEYLALYSRSREFVAHQPDAFGGFDHFTFLRDYVNPLYALNQALIRTHAWASRNTNDYSLNNDCNSIFDKRLYSAQNIAGVYSLVEDTATVNAIREVGKLLFFDPILSGNGLRSCASCHHPAQGFTDTTAATPLQFDRQHRLPRNAPTLLNVVYNHLIMLDGKHTTLQEQASAVIANPLEMNGDSAGTLQRILSCPQYRSAFDRFRKRIPEEKRVTLDHIVSAITLYYGRFSEYASPFDVAMNRGRPVDAATQRGFNVFMGRGQCATCHFVPQFNGVKPPYISSEFEVLGVPADTTFTTLSADRGRYEINPAPEMLHAFRTGTVRNAELTAPYMHNGVFKTLRQVVDFYDAGGGVGRGLRVAHQTLSPDSLRLSPEDKGDLLAFLHALTENSPFETPPTRLPASSDRRLNGRRVGGEY